MRAMYLPRRARSVVALLTGVLLLLCQTAFAAHLCAHSSAPANTAAVTAPCHESVHDANTGAPIVPLAGSACEKGKAVGDAAKVQVYALADLPAVVVTYSQTAAPIFAAGASEAVQTVCYSPPLSILRCRLLN